MSLSPTLHIPILVSPIVESLLEPLSSSEKTPLWIMDCTFGGGGHSGAFLEKIRQNPELKHVHVLGVDRDLRAIQRGQEKFREDLHSGRLRLVHSAFSSMGKMMTELSVAGILADLGFSSDQLEDSERGFSFHRDGPLDMRMNQNAGESCHEYLSHVSESELADVIFEYGEERASRRVARTLVLSRQKGTLPQTTKELAALIVQAMPPKQRHGRIHAATRTFQALRVKINNELGELDSLLDDVIIKLNPGRRAAIMSFHSLEDRRVKNFFKANEFRPLSKKPLIASEEEVQSNSRARSAKLRIAEKI